MANTRRAWPPSPRAEEPQVGAAGYGWVPLVLTPDLLATIHGHDERIPVDGFQDAVAITSDVVGLAAS